MEYGGLGLIAAAAAALLGVASAYLLLTRVIGSDFVFDAAAVISATLPALAITLVLGVALTWRALGRSSAEMLRSDV